MPISDFTYDIIQATPAPTLGKITLEIRDVVYTASHKGTGYVWQVQDANNYYCVYFDGPLLGYHQLLLYRVVAGTPTLLDSGTLPDMDSAFGHFFVYFENGTMSVDFHNHNNSYAVSTIVSAVDTTHSTVGGVGLLLPDSNWNESFYVAQISRFLVYDETPAVIDTNGAAVLTANATVTAAGTVTVASTTKEGAAVLSGTATVTAAGQSVIIHSAACLLTGEATVTIDVSAGMNSAMQTDFRWRNDDGTETTATWLAATNQDAPVELDTFYRLRIAIQNNNTNATDLNSLGLEVSLNGGAWGPAHSVAGATIGCKPSYILEKTIDIRTFGNGEFECNCPHLVESSAGNLHWFYSSEISGTWSIRHRRSINGGATWDNFSNVPTSVDLVFTGGVHLQQIELFTDSTGDLFLVGWMHGGVTGTVTWTTVVWKSTNNGGSWVEQGIAHNSSFLSLTYWEAYMDSNDDIWVSVTRKTTQSAIEYLSECHKSTDGGVTWTVGYPFNVSNNKYSYAALGYFDSTYTFGIKFDTYELYSTPGNYITKNTWPGTSGGTFVNISVSAQITNDPLGVDSAFFVSPKIIGSDNVPLNNLCIIDHFDAVNPWDVRPYKLISGTYTAQPAYEPEHWDYTQPTADWYYKPYSKKYGFFTRSGLYFKGLIFTNLNYVSNSVFDYTHRLKTWFVNNYSSTSKILGTGAGTTELGSPTYFHPTSGKSYCLSISNTLYYSTRFTYLAAESDGLQLKAYDDGDDCTQQITSGTFLATNYGVSLFGTAGHNLRQLAVSQFLELEFYVKLNSAVVSVGDTVCFRVNGADSYKNVPCVFISSEAAELLCTASVTATGSVDGPKASVSGTATVTAKGGIDFRGAASLAGTSLIAAAVYLDKLANATMQAYAYVSPLGTCSKEAAVSLVGTATIETLSQSVVKGKASLQGTATTNVGTPVIEVACKASLVGTSKLTPHGVRTTTGKASLKAFAYMGVRRSVLGDVDELPRCLTIYKWDDVLEVVREGMLEVVREDVLVIEKTSDELVIYEDEVEVVQVYGRG